MIALIFLASLESVTKLEFAKALKSLPGSYQKSTTEVELIWSKISKEDTVKRDRLMEELKQVYKLEPDTLFRTRSFIASL